MNNNSHPPPPLPPPPPAGTTDWDGTDHPYYDLADLIEEAAFSRTRPISLLKGINYEIRWFEWATHTPGRLTIVREAIVGIIGVLHKGGARKEAEQILEVAREALAKLIVADEDLKFPGCRTEEGEFLEDKAKGQSLS